MRRVVVSMLGILLAAASALGAVEQVDLDNGMTVLLAPQRGAPVVAVGAYVRVGRVDEPPELAGATHFVEHMMFRATGRRPEGGSEREAWRTGARMIAHTTEDYTRFLVTLPSARLDLALDVLSDALTSAAFRPEEVEEERKVVLEEIARRAADPETRAWEEVQAMAFLPHPYGAPIAGTAGSVSRIGRDRLYEWFRTRYRPDQTCLVLVGDFDRGRGLAAIRRWFGPWESVVPPPPPGPKTPAAPGRYQEEVLRGPDASPVLLVAAPAPGYLDPDYVPARFLEEVLSGWVRERLVGPDGPAIDTGSWFSPFLDRNLIRLRITLAGPEDAARARDRLLELFAEMRGPAFPFAGTAELAENYRARELLLRERLSDFADVVGRAALAGYYAPPGPPEHLAASDRYSRVEVEDLKRLARRVLALENLRLLFLLPPGAPTPEPPDPASVRGARSRPVASAPLRRLPRSEEDASPAAAEGRLRRDREARVTRLSSGARLVHLEDDSVPLVGVAIAFPSGSGRDPPGKSGLARLAIEALPRSTRGYRTSELRWRLFALGNSYEFTADRDTTRVTMTVPRDRLREALLILSTMLTDPAFTDTAVREARGRLVQAIRSSRDRIGSYAGERFRAELFAGDGYAHDPAGDEDSLAKITREDLMSWHRDHLRIEGAWIALVGDVAPRRARRLVSEAFGGEPTPGPAPAALARAAAAPSPRRLSFPHPSGRGFLIVGARAPGHEDPDAPAVALLQQALGWRVFHEFTDVRSSAYEAGAFHDEFVRSGVFGLFVGTDSGSLGDAESYLRGELEAAGRSELSPALVEDAKRAWQGAADLASLSFAAVAGRLAWRGAAGLGPTSFSELRARIDALGTDDLRRVAAERFRPDRLTVLRIGP